MSASSFFLSTKIWLLTVLVLVTFCMSPYTGGVWAKPTKIIAHDSSKRSEEKDTNKKSQKEDARQNDQQETKSAVDAIRDIFSSLLVH